MQNLDFKTLIIDLDLMTGQKALVDYLNLIISQQAEKGCLS